ncbi:collagen, type V/XI/XXIV/XXVII, alpha, partial [Actinokineospora alba]
MEPAAPSSMTDDQAARFEEPSAPPGRRARRAHAAPELVAPRIGGFEEPPADVREPAQHSTAPAAPWEERWPEEQPSVTHADPLPRHDPRPTPPNPSWPSPEDAGSSLPAAYPSFDEVDGPALPSGPVGPVEVSRTPLSEDRLPMPQPSPTGEPHGSRSPDEARPVAGPAPVDGRPMAFGVGEPAPRPMGGPDPLEDSSAGRPPHPADPGSPPGTQGPMPGGSGRHADPRQGPPAGPRPGHPGDGPGRPPIRPGQHLPEGRHPGQLPDPARPGGQLSGAEGLPGGSAEHQSGRPGHSLQAGDRPSPMSGRHPADPHGQHVPDGRRPGMGPGHPMPERSPGQASQHLPGPQNRPGHPLPEVERSMRPGEFSPSADGQTDPPHRPMPGRPPGQTGLHAPDASHPQVRPGRPGPDAPRQLGGPGADAPRPPMRPGHPGPDSPRPMGQSGPEVPHHPGRPGPDASRPPSGQPGSDGSRPPSGRPGPDAPRPPMGNPGPDAARPPMRQPGPDGSRAPLGQPDLDASRPPLG